MLKGYRGDDYQASYLEMNRGEKMESVHGTL